MDPDQQRIEEDLRGLVQGEVRCDDVFTQLYATDASIYELRPLGVVRPRSVDDVVAIVRYAAENHLPIHARGAGTGLAGESLGRGLVVDFSRYFRRIVADEGPARPRSAGRRAGVVESLFAAQRPVIRSRPGHAQRDHDGQRRGDRRRRQPLAALRIGPAACGRTANRSGRWHGASCRPASGDRETMVTRKKRTAPRRLDRPGGFGCRAREAAFANDRGPKAQKRGQLQRISARRRTGRRPIRSRQVARRQRRHAGPDHRSNREHRPATASSKLRAVAVREFGPGSPRGAGNRRVESGRLRPDGPSPPEPRPRNRCPLRAADSRRSRGGAARRTSRRQPTATCSTSWTKSSSWCNTKRVWPPLRTSPKTKPTFNCTGAWPSGSCRRSIACKVRSRPTPCIEDIAVPVAALPVFLRHVQDTLKHLQVTASVFGHAAQGQLHIRPVFRPLRPRRRRHDGIARQRALRKSLAAARHDQRRARRRLEPHAISRPAIRPARECVSRAEADLRSARNPQPGQDRANRSDANDAAHSRRAFNRVAQPPMQRFAGDPTTAIRKRCSSCSFVGSRRKWRRPPGLATAAGLAERRRPTRGCARSSA